MKRTVCMLDTLQASAILRARCKHSSARLPSRYGASPVVPQNMYDARQTARHWSGFLSSRALYCVALAQMVSTCSCSNPLMWWSVADASVTAAYCSRESEISSS